MRVSGVGVRVFVLVGGVHVCAGAVHVHMYQCSYGVWRTEDTLRCYCSGAVQGLELSK